MTKTKFEVMAALNEVDVPCGPILSMKDIYEDKSLYERGMLVELDHPTRGRYVQVGMPINLSDSPVEVKRSPLLGEHTDEVLELARLRRGEIAELHEEGRCSGSSEDGLSAAPIGVSGERSARPARVAGCHMRSQKTRSAHPPRLGAAARARPAEGPPGRSGRRWPRCRRCSASASAGAIC